MHFIKTLLTATFILLSINHLQAEAQIKTPKIVENHNKTVNSGKSTNFKHTHTFFREKKVISKNGKEEIKREYVTQVLPGEELLGIATYTYKSNEPAENPVFTLPLPKETIYVKGSATNEKYVWFSVDDGKSWSRFRDLRVTEPNGIKRIATGNDVTHLQWRMAKDLNKGDSGELEYHVIVR